MADKSEATDASVDANAKPTTNNGGQRAESWRGLSSHSLEANTVMFAAKKKVSTETYLQAIASENIDVVYIQITSMGTCRVTLSQKQMAQELANKGFQFEGEQIFPQFYKPVSQIHIHDLPVWISDSVLTSVLSSYGTVIGSIRHSRIRVGNSFVSTGVRFATFQMKPNKKLPEYLRTTEGTHEFRVTYEGQPKSCRHCRLPDHTGQPCPKRSGSTRSAESKNGKTAQNNSNGSAGSSSACTSTPKTGSCTENQACVSVSGSASSLSSTFVEAPSSPLRTPLTTKEIEEDNEFPQLNSTLPQTPTPATQQDFPDNADHLNQAFAGACTPQNEAPWIQPERRRRHNTSAESSPDASQQKKQVKQRVPAVAGSRYSPLALQEE